MLDKFIIKYIGYKNGRVFFQIHNKTDYSLKNFLLDVAFYNELGDNISFGNSIFMYTAGDLDEVVRANSKRVVVFSSYSLEESLRMANYKVYANAELVRFSSTHDDYFDVRYTPDDSVPYYDESYHYPGFLNGLQFQIKDISKNIEKFRMNSNCCSQGIGFLRNTEKR